MRMGVFIFFLKLVIFCMEYWCWKDVFFLLCRKGMLILELWIFFNDKGIGFGSVIYKKIYLKFLIFLFYIMILILIIIIECWKEKYIIIC